jgi:hypothetical protein
VAAQDEFHVGEDRGIQRPQVAVKKLNQETATMVLNIDICIRRGSRE